MIAFDFETYLLNDTYNRTPPIVCASVSDGKNTEVFLKKDALDYLRWALQNETIIGTNIKYDLFCAIAADDSFVEPVVEALTKGTIVDICVAQALIDIHDGFSGQNRITNKPMEKYSLSYLCEYWLGIQEQKATTKRGNYGTAKQWRLRYALLDGIPLNQWPIDAIDYVRKDAIYPLKIWKMQEETKNPNLAHLADNMRADFALQYTAMAGVRTHKERVRVFADKVREKHQKALRAFLRVGIYKTDKKGKISKDTKKLAAMVTQAYNGEPPLTPTGKPQTSVESLENSGNKILNEFAKCSNNEKMYSTYLPLLESATEYPILPRYKTLLATGRTSCGHPNMQNLPRMPGVRECFIPHPGFVLSSTDYGALELCTLAQITYWLFGASSMREAINSGKDPHAMLGSTMMHTSYETFVQHLKKGLPQYQNIRQLAKVGNFGLPGGMGLETWVRSLTKEGTHLCTTYNGSECGKAQVISERTGAVMCVECLEVAAFIKKSWLSCWPEMEEYFAYISDITRDGEGSVTIPHGLTRGLCRYTQAANTLFQGLAAQGGKRALWAVSRECLVDRRSALWGSRPWAFIHDEIVGEHPIDRAPEAADRLSQIMVGAFKETTPDVIVKAEPALMDCWQKGAKTKRDSNGRLQICHLEKQHVEDTQ